MTTQLQKLIFFQKYATFAEQRQLLEGRADHKLPGVRRGFRRSVSSRPAVFAGSSKGRTTVFGTVYRGSSPCPAATRKNTCILQVFLRVVAARWGRERRSDVSLRTSEPGS